MKKPVLGLTMGDPAGIGSEIIVKSLRDKKLYEKARPVVFGDAAQLKRLAKITHNEDVEIRTIASPKDADPNENRIEVIDIKVVPEDVPFGKVNAECCL